MQYLLLTEERIKSKTQHLVQDVETPLISLQVNIVGVRRSDAATYLIRSSNQLRREHGSWKRRSERLILTAIKARGFLIFRKVSAP